VFVFLVVSKSHFVDTYSIITGVLILFFSEGEIKYARIPTGDNDEKKQKITAMKKVDKYIKGTAELLYLYPDTMKHSLKFVETPEKEKTSHYLSLYYHIFEEIIFFRSRRSETERS